MFSSFVNTNGYQQTVVVLKNTTVRQQGKGMQPAAMGSTAEYVLKSTPAYCEGQGTGGETGNFKTTHVLVAVSCR